MGPSRSCQHTRTGIRTFKNISPSNFIQEIEKSTINNEVSETSCCRLFLSEATASLLARIKLWDGVWHLNLPEMGISLDRSVPVSGDFRVVPPSADDPMISPALIWVISDDQRGY